MIPFPPFPSKASGVVSFGDKYGKEPWNLKLN
jgi:hypothetical protein